MCVCVCVCVCVCLCPFYHLAFSKFFDVTDGFETTGVFGPPKDAVAYVSDKIKEGKSNGYFQSHGM